MAFVAGVYSFFLPGLGQIVNGERRKGFWMCIVVGFLSAFSYLFFPIFFTGMIWYWSFIDAMRFNPTHQDQSAYIEQLMARDLERSRSLDEGSKN